MLTAHHELGNYGVRRLRKIANFLRHGGRGAWALLDDRRYELAITSSMTKTMLVERIATCGVFEEIANRFGNSWERLISEIVTNQNFVYGLCNLFGVDTDKVLLHLGFDNDKSVGLILIQKIVNKLSVVYMFPGDPTMARCRKRMNDIRLNALFKNNIFGKEPMTIAKEISSFHDAIKDPIMRIIFWSCYKPGTGQFKVSVSNLDQIINEEESCPICLDCLDNLTPGIRLKPCGHSFHPKCIQELILSVDKMVVCPMCRTEVEDFY